MRSMTGFGRGHSTSGNWRVEVELSGVNRKQVDIAINLPASLTELEGDIRRLLSESVSRGRIGVKVALSNQNGSETQLVFDEAMARQYVDAARNLSATTGIETRITAADLFRAPGIFKIDESGAQPDEVCEALFNAVEQALSQLIEMQREEGKHIVSDLRERLATIAKDLEAIGMLAPRVPEGQRTALHARLNEAGIAVDLDDERILREIALYAERCDITEELTRLRSHLSQFSSSLESEEPMGRPLDFLCQELNRELNTIGSKANDAEIAQRIVNAKTELEKVREQVQNVQ